jgi:hypothetical protein
MFEPVAASNISEYRSPVEDNMKFMLFFKGGLPKEQDREAHGRLWQEYMEELKNRKMFESGAAFGLNGRKVTQNIISEWSPKKDDLTGYLVINASSFEQAVEIAKGAPHTRLGGSTVIRECVVMQPALSVA